MRRLAFRCSLLDPKEDWVDQVVPLLAAVRDHDQRSPWSCGCDHPLSDHQTCVWFVGTDEEIDIDRARVVIGPAPRAAQGDAQWSDFDGRTLRFAMAMRGGVSLAVWIGGVVAEFDLLRSIRVVSATDGTGRAAAFAYLAGPLPRQHPSRDRAGAWAHRAARIDYYGRLLAEKEYHKVEVDILAGASAGGLNGVLFAGAQRSGTSMERVLDTWIEAGAAASLLRTPGVGVAPSILMGDDYFFVGVRRALRAMYAENTGRHPAMQSDFVSLDLSASVLNAQDSKNQDIRDGRGGFHFVAGGEGNDIPAHRPGGLSPEQSLSLDRLALAARTTSSFPGAFEPAEIWSLLTGGVPPVAYRGPVSADMSATFIVQRDEAASDAARAYYQVIDGGLYDNIPISRAFHAIGPRPAEVPTRRALMYLDPDPSEEPVIRRRVFRRVGDFVTIVARGLSSRMQSETHRSDDEEIHSFISQRSLESAQWEGLAATPEDAEASLTAREGERYTRLAEAYRRSRSKRDLELVGKVLEDAEAWSLAAADLDPPQAYRRLDSQPGSGEWQERFGLHFLCRANDLGEMSLTRDSSAANDTAAWLIVTVQFLERVRRDASDGASLDSYRDERKCIRDLCYAALRASAVTRDAKLRRLFPFAAEGTDASALEAVDIWMDAQDDATTEWDLLGQAWTLLRPILREWSLRAEPSEGDGGPCEGRKYSVRRWWSEAPWRRLLAIAPEGPLEAVPMLLAALGEPPVIDEPVYRTVDGVWKWGEPPESNPLRAPIELARAARLRDIRQAMMDDARGADARQRAAVAASSLSGAGSWRIPSKYKLAGTRFLNFSGFLSRDLRIADWWWGRIDAAASLADMLSADPKAPDGESTAAANAAALVASEAGSLPTKSSDAQMTAPDLSAGLAGATRLRPAYAYSLVAQIARLVARAIPGASSGITRFGIQSALIVSRPLALLMTALGDRPRAAGIALVALAGIACVSQGSPADFSWIVGVTGSLFALVLWILVAAVLNAVPRWATLRAVLGADAIHDDRLMAAWKSIALAACSLALVPACGWLLSQGQYAAAVLVGCTAAAIALAARSAMTTIASTVRVERGFRLMMPIVGVVLLVVALVWRTVNSEALPWPVMVAALFVDALLFTWSWLPIPESLIVATAASIAGGGAVVLAFACIALGAPETIVAWAWVVGVYVWAHAVWLLPAWFDLAGPAAREDEIRALKS